MALANCSSPLRQANGASRLALPYFAEAGTQIELRLPLALFAFAVAMLTGIVSSLYPVIRASRLDASEAVRYV